MSCNCLWITCYYNKSFTYFRYVMLVVFFLNLGEGQNYPHYLWRGGGQIILRQGIQTVRNFFPIFMYTFSIILLQYAKKWGRNLNFFTCKYKKIMVDKKVGEGGGAFSPQSIVAICLLFTFYFFHLTKENLDLSKWL